MIKALVNSSIRTKFTLVVSGITLLVFLVSAFLLSNLNAISDEIGMVYESNIRLNELTLTLDGVQESMSDYLNTKSRDSMDNYYRKAQELKTETEKLHDIVTGSPAGLAEKNIRSLVGTYLKETDSAIEAKRGRKVESYKVSYENTVRLHRYIAELIAGLNDVRFQENMEGYDFLMKTMHRIEMLCMIIFALSALMGILFVIKISDTITTPLRDLAIAAGEVSSGNYDVSLTVGRSTDEIGRVTDALTSMTQAIQDHIVKLRENMEKEQELKENALIMEAHLKDAQLRYLQAQINPHFLFNTLNAGAQLAMMEGADRAYEYIKNVAAFFRYNIQTDPHDVSLSEELHMVDIYMYILNVRFAGEIGYEKDIDERYLNVRIPGMTLQPIVENCYSHGIRNITWEGIITIKVYRLGSRVCISIRDNGVGMPPERIRQVLSDEKLESRAASNGIAMHNVKHRLELLYQRSDIMDILSEGPDMGTEVLLYIPLEENHV